MQITNKNRFPKRYEVNWIFYGALAITLYFDAQAQDPFNLPKFFLLALITPILLSYIFTSRVTLTKEEKRFYRAVNLLCAIYLGFMLLSSFFAYSFQVAILGESFRRNGTLTYLGFLTFFLASVKYVRFENILIGLRIVFFVGALTGVYALIQITGNDWVKWSATNQTISTFGNTNFSGAGMALFAIIIFGLLVSNFNNKLVFICYVVIFLTLVYAIVQTNARQAIIILILGLSIFSSLFLFRKNKKIWLIGIFAGVLCIIFAVLGIFKVGPIQNFIYKDSISVREYYWRAGIEMFQQNLLHGVGPDHYGIYFKQFRDVGYPLTYGWGITSSNAHNVFIQNFATGGIFVGSAYLALQLLIVYRAFRLIRNTDGDKQVIAVLVFSAWIAYQAQSLISIEFIGVSIWGWILGGSLIGLSFQGNEISEIKSRKSIQVNFPRLLLATVLFIGFFVVANSLRQGEKDMWRQSIQITPGNNQQLEIFNGAVTDVLGNNLLNSDYRNLTAVNLLGKGERNRAVEILTETISKDPRNLDTLALLVDTNEKNGDFEVAILFRKEISKYDPWNAQNYLGLAQLYKQTGNFSDMSNMVNKILTIAPNDPISRIATQEFPPVGN